MSHVIVNDDAQKQLLRSPTEELEVRSQNGTVLGYFVPFDLYKSSQYQWANSLVTDKELDEARRQPPGRTTQEILQRLRSSTK
jgi:hypothetical protein